MGSISFWRKKVVSELVDAFLRNSSSRGDAENALLGAVTIDAAVSLESKIFLAHALKNTSMSIGDDLRLTAADRTNRSVD